MSRKQVWLWMQRAVLGVMVVAFLARMARLPFAYTLTMWAVAGWVAVGLLMLVITLLHRRKWISELPWDEKPKRGLDAEALLGVRAPIIPPAPLSIARTPSPAPSAGTMVQPPLRVTWTISKVLRPTVCALS
jgi:hypothetical protein